MLVLSIISTVILVFMFIATVLPLGDEFDLIEKGPNDRIYTLITLLLFAFVVITIWVLYGGIK